MWYQSLWGTNRNSRTEVDSSGAFDDETWVMAMGARKNMGKQQKTNIPPPIPFSFWAEAAANIISNETESFHVCLILF